MATYWENSCSFGLRYVSWYKYLIVGLVFSHLGFWSGNLFLIAPFPDLCLLVPFLIGLSVFCAIFSNRVAIVFVQESIESQFGTILIVRDFIQINLPDKVFFCIICPLILYMVFMCIVFSVRIA